MTPTYIELNIGQIIEEAKAKMLEKNTNIESIDHFIDHIREIVILKITYKEAKEPSST